MARGDGGGDEGGEGRRAGRRDEGVGVGEEG